MKRRGFFGFLAGAAVLPYAGRLPAAPAGQTYLIVGSVKAEKLKAGSILAQKITKNSEYGKLGRKIL